MSAPVNALGVSAALILAAAAAAGDIEQPPFRYSKATPDNVVSRLKARLDGGKGALARDDDHGYLKAVLKELDVPLSSQVLVFSKTSLQRHRIGPRTPRAIYFNDDVYVGFCKHGDMLELSAADPKLGAVFYTVDQDPEAATRVTRQTDSCLLCHGGSATAGYPGHLVRSLYADAEGQPNLALGSVRVDHTTAFADRWGGWYVTGTSGRMGHRGNQTVGSRDRFPPDDNAAGVNVTDLKRHFTVGDYPTPHSDLVALMVLEHQAEMHNRIARAGYETRLAVWQQADFDRILDRKTEGLNDSTRGRIRSACEPLVKYLFFCEEAKLTDAVKGTSRFAEEFAARGPADARGRSLRQFDLKTRLFRHPCSYLVYSKAFDGLPAEAREYVGRRMNEVLSGKDSSAEFAHLTAADRKAVLEILRATKPGLLGGR